MSVKGEKKTTGPGRSGLHFAVPSALGFGTAPSPNMYNFIGPDTVVRSMYYTYTDHPISVSRTKNTDSCHTDEFDV